MRGLTRTSFFIEYRHRILSGKIHRHVKFFLRMCDRRQAGVSKYSAECSDRASTHGPKAGDRHADNRVAFASSIIGKHNATHKTGSIFTLHCIIALSSEKDRATATGNTDKKLDVTFGHAVLGRPFVKRFALCYRSVVTLVYCGQTVGWIKMKLGTEV